MVISIAVVVLLGQNDLSGLDRLEHGFEIFGVEVLAIIDASKILCEVLQLHSLVALQVGIVLISVQHNDSVGEDVDGILIRDPLRLRHFEVVLGKIRDNTFDQRRFARETERMKELPECFVKALSCEVKQTDKGLENASFPFFEMNSPSTFLSTLVVPLTNSAMHLGSSGSFMTPWEAKYAIPALGFSLNLAAPLMMMPFALAVREEIQRLDSPPSQARRPGGLLSTARSQAKHPSIGGHIHCAPCGRVGKRVSR